MLILADLNCDPQDSETCRQACLRDGWTDCAVAAGNFNPTHYPPHGNPRRLDVVFLNKTAAVAFQQYDALDDRGLPNHLPIRIQLHVPAFRTLYNQLKRPQQFSPDHLKRLSSEDENRIFTECWLEVCDDWDQFVTRNDSNILWSTFNKLAERFLCRRASIQDSKKFMGRGTFPKFVLQPAVGISRPIQHGGSQTTCRERMLRKLARQIHFLSTQLPSNLGTWPKSVSDLWDKIQQRCKILRIPVDLAQLASIRTAALHEADTLSRQTETAAIERWRDKIKLDFASTKRETYKWLSREYRCDQVFLKNGNKFTANSADIDHLVRSVWEPIMNRAPTETTPSWQVFVSEFARFIPDVPAFELAPLTTGRLRTVLNKMAKYSAAGLDNWSVAAVQSLPDLMLGKLCDVFHVIEQSQRWPFSFTSGYFCLIPKPESDNSPSSLRPLSILSVLYRAWASMRLSELMMWQETWCHPSQSGFRSLHDCLDSWYPLALQVEQALLNGTPLNGCFLDYEKAFDLLPLHEIILPLAKHLGLPDFFVNCLSDLYGRLVRFFKHPKGFGSAIKSDRGIVQGCPISVVLLNLLMAIFLRFAEHDRADTCPQAYADDVSASAPSVDDISCFLLRAGSFAQITGQRLKLKSVICGPLLIPSNKNYDNSKLDQLGWNWLLMSAIWAHSSAFTMALLRYRGNLIYNALTNLCVALVLCLCLLRQKLKLLLPAQLPSCFMDVN